MPQWHFSHLSPPTIRTAPVWDVGPTLYIFTVIRLTLTHGGKIYVHSQETKELAMDANRSGRREYTARQDFLVRVTIAVAMFYGFVVSVSL
jgi:hypothetical protein